MKLFKNYDIILLVRDLVKKIIIGIALLITPSVFAEDYKVLVLPDNIVTDNIEVDSFIYNTSAEFFAGDVINILNGTDYISSPTVSETRALYKQEPSIFMSAKNLTNRFQNTYNIDFMTLKKLAQKSNANYVLLITSQIDSQNYILRRTVWDFLNIPGATVVDPAYKISTYAVLVDVNSNQKLWQETFDKTISVCENRIITRGASPQTEQLHKIKDYSKFISSQIAKNVQKNILSEENYLTESKHIDCDISNIDNVFTKKYRYYGEEYQRYYNKAKTNVQDFTESTIDKYEKYSQERQLKKQKKQEELKLKKEVKAVPIYKEEKPIKSNKERNDKNIKNTVLKKDLNEEKNPDLINIEIKKKKKQNLYGEYQINQPELRDYN